VVEIIGRGKGKIVAAALLTKKQSDFIISVSVWIFGFDLPYGSGIDYFMN